MTNLLPMSRSLLGIPLGPLSGSEGQSGLFLLSLIFKWLYRRNLENIPSVSFFFNTFRRLAVDLPWMSGRILLGIHLAMDFIFLSGRLFITVSMLLINSSFNFGDLAESRNSFTSSMFSNLNGLAVFKVLCYKILNFFGVCCNICSFLVLLIWVLYIFWLGQGSVDLILSKDQFSGSLTLFFPLFIFH